MNKTDAIREYRKFIQREGAAPSLVEVQTIVEVLGLTSNDVIEDINVLSQHTEAKAKADKVQALRGEFEQAEAHYRLVDTQLAARQVRFHMSGLREFSLRDADFKSKVASAARDLSDLRQKLSRAQEGEQELREIESSQPRLFDAPDKPKAA